MSKSLFFKLAASNIKKNGRIYIPYIFTSILTTSMFYIIYSLSLNTGISGLHGSETIKVTLNLGNYVVAVFAAIFLFYTNSFIMKRRKKEFGLFNILGMEKKHIYKIIGIEILYIAFISLVSGILLGILLDKVMYLIILSLMNADVPLGFYVSTEAVVAVLILFALIFTLIYLNSLRQIHKLNPSELLKSENSGEREPKAKWIIAIIGILSLGGGYFISLTVDNVVISIFAFFIAVLLVILGTYLIFTAGSVALLKILHKNKKYYYKSNNFINVSCMIYRMKQNAVGLANICILSTMVLVMVSATISMWIGIDNILETRYPYDISVYSNDTDNAITDEIIGLVRQTAGEKNIEKETSYTYLTFTTVREGNEFIVNDESVYEKLNSLNNFNILYFITLSDFNKAADTEYSLNDKEVLMYSNREGFGFDSLKLFGQEYKIRKKLSNFQGVGNGALISNISGCHFIVVKDESAFNVIFETQKSKYIEMYSKPQTLIGIDLNCGYDEQIAIYNTLKSELTINGYNCSAESKAESKPSFFSLYGGFLFLGVFLGTLFIMAAILIIYYKQISEGYQDKSKFEILQKVGMSLSEVKTAIHSQILTVFFLPLLTAGMHIVFAFPIISKILNVLNLTDINLYIICTFGCFIAFTLMYTVIYAVTSRTYYKIVKR